LAAVPAPAKLENNNRTRIVSLFTAASPRYWCVHIEVIIVPLRWMIK